MRRVVTCFVASTAALGGCSSASVGADCSVVIRYRDAIYREDGFTKVVDAEAGTADLAACDDTGASARGPFFPEDPEQVLVWSIPGRNATHTVAIAYSGDGYRVMTMQAANEP